MLVEDAAQAWVTAWLTTPRERAGELSRFWSGRVDLPTEPAMVSGTDVASVEDLGDGVWAVTVAARVTPPTTTDPDTGVLVPAPTERRYFLVPVVLDEAVSTVAIAGLPAPIAGPALRAAPSTAYSEQLTLGSAPAQAAAGFVQALTTGQGEISRLVSPGSSIAAITPPVASHVEIDHVAVRSDDAETAAQAEPADAAQIHVLVSARLVDTAGDARSTAYALTLRARDGRWEVHQINPAPQLDVVEQPTTPLPSESGPPSTPTTVPSSSTP